MSDNKYNHIHLIDGEIQSCPEIHPFNNKDINDLKNKSFFINTFKNDLKGKSKYTDISGKNNLFNFSIGNENFNIFVEHSDAGGKDISFNKADQKVLIPYSLKSFQQLIKDMKNALVIDLYFELTKNSKGLLEPNKNKYCYLIIIPSEIYTSEVTHNILFKTKKANGSSRWVRLVDIKKCIDTRQTLINREENVWIVHPSNLDEFLKTIVLDDYKNQFRKSYFRLLELLYSGNKITNEKQKEVNNARRKLRESILSRKKCEILNCNVDSPECLVASHIWPVNQILLNKLEWNEKIKHISNPNNAFLLCGLHDKLLDKFLITFDDKGNLIPSKILKNSLAAYSLCVGKQIIKINDLNKFYLKKHRELFVDAESSRLDN